MNYDKRCTNYAIKLAITITILMVGMILVSVNNNHMLNGMCIWLGMSVAFLYIVLRIKTISCLLNNSICEKVNGNQIQDVKSYLEKNRLPMCFIFRNKLYKVVSYELSGNLLLYSTEDLMSVLQVFSYGKNGSTEKVSVCLHEK